MASDGPVVRAGTHIFAWGRGDLGQLGLSQDTSESGPVLVTALDFEDIAHVAASVYNSAFITGQNNWSCCNIHCNKLWLYRLHSSPVCTLSLTSST